MESGARYLRQRGAQSQSRLNAPLWLAVVATLGCAGLFFGHEQQWLTVPGLDELELLSVDARFGIRGARAPTSDDIVIVGLDDRARDEAVELFQSRRGMAELIAALGRYQPRAIGVDLMFDSAEEMLPAPVVSEAIAARDALAKDDIPSPARARAQAALAAVIEATRGDEILAQSIADTGRVHLAVLFHLGGDSWRQTPEPEPAGAAGARFGEWVATAGPRATRPPRARAVTATRPEIAQGAAAAGAVNIIRDSDGGVRRIYGVLNHGGRYYMPLGLSMALAKLESDAAYVAGEEFIRVGERRLPTSARGELALSFLGPKRTFGHISAADVLAGHAPEEALAGKLVLIGFTDTARDKIATPFDPLLDGVEAHATLIHNVLHDELMRYAGPEITLLVIALLGAAISVLQLRRIRRKRWWGAGAAVLAVTLGYGIIAQSLFSASAVIIDVSAPIASGAIITLSALVASLATEGREKARLRATFSQYVAESLIERLLADPDQATLGGQRRELSVLFSDIRGFATLAEKLEPEALSEFLNEYFTPMTQVIMDEGGMLDKYIGDAVMAVYGAPIDMDDHAERACSTALAMQAALETANRQWRARDLPKISIGIGVNSGPMAVGNMGSETRFDYTVMGDAVNLGARLESLTKEYRVAALCGELTAERAGHRYRFRELDWVRVKGREGVARVYELVGPIVDERESGAPASGAPGIDPDALALYADALAAYRDGRWADARAGFHGFLEAHPEDGPAEVMLERIAQLETRPPEPTWDGVFEQVSK